MLIDSITEFISQSTRIVKTMKTWNRSAGSAVLILFYHNKNDCDGCKQGRKTLKRQKNGGPWRYEPPDEEDIEVCIRCIDLWGRLFIDYYIVACQAFFCFFLFF